MRERCKTYTYFFHRNMRDNQFVNIYKLHVCKELHVSSLRYTISGHYKTISFYKTCSLSLPHFHVNIYFRSCNIDFITQNRGLTLEEIRKVAFIPAKRINIGLEQGTVKSAVTASRETAHSSVYTSKGNPHRVSFAFSRDSSVGPSTRD